MSGNSDHGREALALFADELSALRYLEHILWPNGVCCRRCGHQGKVGKLNGASTRVGTYKCYKCRKTFSVLHGTLMSYSHVPAHKWLQAMYLTEGGTKPMRAHHLHRILNVSFKTAVSMMRRLEWQQPRRTIWIWLALAARGRRARFRTRTMLLLGRRRRSDCVCGP